jgi:hypothetical protein
MNVNPIDRTRGLYGKFHVARADGDPTGKHEGCDYFVLDLVHDPHAKAALIAYAASCSADYPHLAADLVARTASSEPLDLRPPSPQPSSETAKEPTR